MRHFAATMCGLDSLHDHFVAESAGWRRSSGAQVWDAVLSAYLLTPAEFEVLVALVAAVDQLAKINAALVDAPLMVEGSRSNQVANPLLSESRYHAKCVESLQRALALPVEGQQHGRWRDPQRALAADTRWARSASVRARRGSA